MTKVRLHQRSSIMVEKTTAAAAVPVVSRENNGGTESRFGCAITVEKDFHFYFLWSCEDEITLCLQKSKLNISLDVQVDYVRKNTIELRSMSQLYPSISISPKWCCCSVAFNVKHYYSAVSSQRSSSKCHLSAGRLCLGRAELYITIGSTRENT